LGKLEDIQAWKAGERAVSNTRGKKKKALQEKHVPRRKKTEIYIMILSSS